MSGKLFLFSVCLFYVILSNYDFLADASECFGGEPVTGLFTFTFFNWAWHELNRTETANFGSNTTCGRFWYEHAPALPGDPELVVFDHRYPQNASNFVAFGNATVTDDKWTAAVVFPNDTSQSTYKVLGIVKLSYALVYSCAEDSSGIKERAWVLGRQTNVSMYLEEMENIINSTIGLREKLQSLKMTPCEDIHLENECYDVSNKPDLSLDKFFQGNWNQVWRSTNAIDIGRQCASVIYNYNATQEHVSITHKYSNGREIIASGNVTVNDKGKNLIMHFSSVDNKSSYKIVDTDYDNYAVVYSCWQDSIAEKEGKVALLDTRLSVNGSLKHGSN